MLHIESVFFFTHYSTHIILPASFQVDRVNVYPPQNIENVSFRHTKFYTIVCPTLQILTPLKMLKLDEFKVREHRKLNDNFACQDMEN